MDTSMLLAITMACLSTAISVLFLIKCRDSGRYYHFAAIGWAFFAIHAILRAGGVPVALREILTYLFALFVSLYLILNVLEFDPESARLLWMYMLIPTSHIFYRLLSYAGVRLVPRIGGIAGDSGIMLLITAYVTYVTFRRAILSFPLIPMAIALLFYKVIQGTPIGFALMSFGTIVFAISTIRVMGLRLFKGSGLKKPSTGDMKGLFLIEQSRLEKLLDEYREYPLLLITRKRDEYPQQWTVFYLTSVDTSGSINPTALERLRHLVVRYLTEARTAGSQGIVVIDGVDYLRLYNEDKVLLKFLADLRDHAIVNNGIVFLALPEGTLNPKELAVLERISDHVYR
ncbi:DUF835 domain-containing protein [Thermococcus sp. AM4]|uniref:DUF835 domain-containing protein n=1 Tax=Thermococcus sp. (strain AM4) TaxID=246969 RepID=UPI0001870C1B|nr:DUF835 domain-containing protein [Thermococcus sp. AM4]EEB73808.1 conserved hypothetical protein [Thermococcus sp. AM4]